MGEQRQKNTIQQVQFVEEDLMQREPQHLSRVGEEVAEEAEGEAWEAKYIEGARPCLQEEAIGMEDILCTILGARILRKPLSWALPLPHLLIIHTTTTLFIRTLQLTPIPYEATIPSPSEAGGGPTYNQE